MHLNPTDKKAMLVAHPDDETLFGGGIILRNPFNWTVFCCSIPNRDPIRALKFFTACERLGAIGVQYPYRETEILMPVGINLKDFDVLVTHGAEGEYGHPHHKQIHHWVRQNKSPAQEMITFSGKDSFTLTEQEVSRRLYALQAYDHQSNADSAPKWQALIDRYAPTDEQEFQIW